MRSGGADDVPTLPPKHNPFPGKPKLARDRERRARADVRRADDPLRAEYRTERWKREAKAFLASPGNGVCWCGCGRKANTVHHKHPPRGAPTLERSLALFWDRSNWRAAAFACNSREAARSEGGFGNPRR